MAAYLANTRDFAYGQQIDKSSDGCGVAGNGKLAIRLADVRGHLGQQPVWSNPARARERHLLPHSSPDQLCHCFAYMLNKCQCIDELAMPKTFKCKLAGTNRLWPRCYGIPCTIVLAQQGSMFPTSTPESNDILLPLVECIWQ